MKVAVLGVGLIGGSIARAARERLGAEVTGFDPDPAVVEKATDVGAIDSGSSDLAAACEGAGIVFCAAPVAALGTIAGEAIEATGTDTVVTDVGSVKAPLLDELGDQSRFIGGHPLAGAETAGVEHARADLFDGARWYLTPTDLTEGVLYDRLQRAIADLGARPQAIEAAAHDRLMATVSHVPHAVANIMVAEATEALAAGSERLPEVGPSFRDATRVAGANPAIWGDIFTGNSAAVADGIDAVVARLTAAAELIRSGDRTAIDTWHEAAAKARRELLEGDLAGGELHELRVRVPNRPGILAEIALGLGGARVNIEDMALYPTADMTTGAVTLFIAGAEEAARATELIRALGHDVSEVAR